MRMCGIAGVYRHNGAVQEAELWALCRALEHRGPDGEGIWCHSSGKLGFAHRRLAIVDVSPAGRQPMQSSTGRTCIVFNGEIYNFRELQREAARRGWCFRSNSDTEVILALYELDGIACLERLHGMFAFALWDETEGRLWLVRDRLGIKPLYYLWNGTCLAFASELPALQRLSDFDARLDVTALWDFLTYHYIPPPKSMYRSISKLPAGTWVCLDTRQARLWSRRYWCVPEPIEEERSLECALEELDDLLASVVAEHLVADVPVGAFLSGGVDSSLVVAYARRRQPLRVFTVEVEGDAWSERPFAEAVAHHLGVEHRIVRVAAEGVMPAVRRFVRVYGEPFGDTSGLAVVAIAQAARAEVKAVLSGDGADELFAGYIRSRADIGGGGIPVRSRRWVPWLLSRMPSKRGERWLRRLLMPEEQILRTAVWLEWGQKRRLLQPDILAVLPPDYDELWFLRSYFCQRCSPLRQRLLLELQTWLPEKMLTKVDRASMAVGLEVRVPFVDHRLVEWVCRVPDWMLWHPDRGGKWLLKHLLEQELPAPLVYRPKKGFSIPIREWLQQVAWQSRVQESRFWQERIFHPALFREADVRSPVTQFLLLVLAVWSDENPWIL